MARRALLLIVLLAGAGLYARALATARVVSSEIPDLERIAANFGGWTSDAHQLSDEVAQAYGADTYLLRRYLGPGNEEVWLFVAYFRDQQVGAQIHSPKNCVPGAGWSVLSVEPHPLPNGGPNRAQRMLLDKEGKRQELVYWFRTRGGVQSGEYALKMDLIMNALRRRPTDAAFIRYHALAEHGAALALLADALEPSIDRTLSEVGLP